MKDLAGHNLRLERVWRKLVACGIPKKHIKLVVDAFRDELLADAKAGRAPWPGVGVFRRTTRKARRIAHPITHEPMTLPPQVSFGFRAAKAAKERLK